MYSSLVSVSDKSQVVRRTGSRATQSQSPLPNLSGRNEQSKLAAQVASRIVDDVVARGWPVGDLLGSSDEFLERFDVSRAVFREAVRLLEHLQVAQARRGTGGGLVVVEPSVDAIIEAAVLYLTRVDARFDEVLEARSVLDEIAAELAAARVDSEGRSRLRALIYSERSGEIQDRQAFHTLLAELAHNPALELFVEIINIVSNLYMRNVGPTTIGSSSEVQRAHARIAHAVIAGNGTLARELMAKHMRSEVAHLRGLRTSRQMLPPGTALSDPDIQKKAEGLAREIYRNVAADHFEPGHLLGSEPELIERYGVSRAVFREAVRLLEHHHVATMRRGPGGGLFVAEPSSTAVADVVAIYLARKGTGVSALAELRVRVEVSLVDLVIDRLDATSSAALDDALEVDEGDEKADISIHNLHANIARLTGNRALELITLVLIRLTRFHQYRELSSSEESEIRREVNRAHVYIARSIQQGDGDLARKRIRRHLDALTTHLH